MIGHARATAHCRCCTGPLTHRFQVASWRVPGWPTFEYGECADCGSITLIDDIDPVPFYNDYFAHRPRHVPPPSAMRRGLAVVAEHTVMKSPALARVAAVAGHRPEWLGWFAGSGLGRDAAILDVGCGSGALLLGLRRWGFTDLVGADPYLTGSTSAAPGVDLLPCRLEEVSRDDFQVVIFHHSLEHVDDPVRMLQLARDRLAGAEVRIVVALPVAQGPVWEEYRDNWVGLDPPVHRFVPTIEGLRRLAARVGMRTGRMCATSPPYHVVSSELISRRADPFAHPEATIPPRALRHLASRARRLATLARCPQISVVLLPDGGGR